ncbi:MAG TPA: hypothetical protein VFW63_11790 [Acidimicrobiales bacterium]|nr:hypothetical protein [Acidimicrobiales bacterium]
MPVAEVFGPSWVARYRDACASLPVRPGADARVDHVVTLGTGDDVVWWEAFVDGRVVDAGSGPPGLRARTTGATAVDAGAPPLPGTAQGAGGAGGLPQVTVATPVELAVAIAAGDVELAVAFMQGRAKVAGDHAALLRVLAVTASPEYRLATASVGGDPLPT